MPPSKKLTSWSFSRYSDYAGPNGCPKKAKHKHLDKIFEPPNAGMARGGDIHKLCEDYVKGKITQMPAELKLHFEKEFKDLKNRFKKKIPAMVVEDTWAFTKTWEKTLWNDWTGCAVRIKLDCAYFLAPDSSVLSVVDYKTGKFSPFKNAEYIEQLELYGLGALLIFDQADLVVKPQLWYLDTGAVFPAPGSKEEHDLTFTKADLPRLKKAWEKRTKPMLSDTVFPPKPNSGCRFCWYGQSKKAEGGPGLCKF